MGKTKAAAVSEGVRPMTFLASQSGWARDFEARSWLEAERFCESQGLVLWGVRRPFPSGEWERGR